MNYGPPPEPPGREPNRHERRALHAKNVQTVRLAYREWQAEMRKQGRPTSPDAFQKYVKQGARET
jgi:hypothetical protein